MVRISSDFESGNIEVLDAGDPAHIRLAIARDGAADFYQWFLFRVDGASGTPLRLVIENAQGASYPVGWQDYRAVRSPSVTGDHWTRVDTDYQGGALIISDTPGADTVYYAYFAPFTTAQNTALIEASRQALDAPGSAYAGAVHHEVLGHSLDGYPMDYLRLGTPEPGKPQFWVIARQHPGESMGSWWMQGFLDRLARGDDPAVSQLAEWVVLHVIPLMNPDGVARGHLRTNAAGVDLNRAWRNTTPDVSPEVYYVREQMRASGVDFFLDVHGDEGIPNNFLASAKGIPGWSERLEHLFNGFSALLKEESPDFQTEQGYPIPQPGLANPDIATNYVAMQWNCFSATLEMPFKDAAVRPDAKIGWGPSRCRDLAHAHIRAMARFLDQISG